MRSLVTLLALSAVSVAALAACSTEPAPEQKLAKHLEPIAGGQFDHDHTSVVGMFTLSGQGGGMCSGTLIAPNLVLTARHCISPMLGQTEYVVCGESTFGPPYNGGNVYVTNDLQMSQHSDNWWQGDEIRVPSEGNDTCGFDVALVILAQPVPESVAKPYVPRIDVEPTADEIYQAVGYGSTGASYGGSRMVRTNLIVQCGPASCPGYYGIASTEWLGDTVICQGDSGGPALDMTDKVIGVVSRGSQGCDTPIYGSVTAWKNWLMEVAVYAAEKGGYPAPFWALSGKSDPEEPPVGTGGSGGASGAGGSGGSGASSGAAGTSSPPDPQGTPCTGSCPDGYACFSAGSTNEGICTAKCDANNPCGGGLTCDTGNNVCVGAAPGSGDSGGCAVGSSGPAKPVPWALGLAALALACLRRRR